MPDLVHVMRTLATESIPNLPPGGELASKWVHISVNVFLLLLFKSNLTARPLLKVRGGRKGAGRMWSVLQLLLLNCSEWKGKHKNRVNYESLLKITCQNVVLRRIKGVVFFFKGGLSVSVFVINWVSLGGTWFEGTKITYWLPLVATWTYGSALQKVLCISCFAWQLSFLVCS